MRVIVRSGDSFWYYSQLFYLPLILIEDSNPNVNPNQLRIGQTIQIPGFITESYTLRQGDTLWKIARARNIHLDALLLLNQDKNPYQLNVGDTITLPRRVTDLVIHSPDRYDFQKLQADVETLIAIYPFARRRVIGQSVLNQPLYELRIGRGSLKVQVNAAFHANEWITSPVLIRFINEYLLALTNAQPINGVPAINLYQTSLLSAVPMVNPDGVNLVLNGPPPNQADQVIALNNGSQDFSGWKANIRGVDLNKQFPANWEIEKSRLAQEPGPRDYPGTSPLTEPETITMANLVQQEAFHRLIALHTQGQEIYWGYQGLEPPEAAGLATDFSRLSGYRAVQNIDSHAGYRDWYIQTFRRPGFTFELGLGQNPLPISQFPEIYAQMKPVFVRALT